MSANIRRPPPVWGLSIEHDMALEGGPHVIHLSPPTLANKALKNRPTLDLIDSDTTFEQYTQPTPIRRPQPYLAPSLDTRGCQLVHGRDEPVRSESPRRWLSTRSKAPKVPRLHSGLDYVELLKSGRCVSCLWEETRDYHHHNSRPKRREGKDSVNDHEFNELSQHDCVRSEATAVNALLPLSKPPLYRCVIDEMQVYEHQ
ncbi:hypothetical protein BKA60DRAFT_543289 [Fusarium oxysporum]|nr:hypothetical protein BKA60DRAFT_543289 [Fusarium oxysporum]